MVVVVLSGLPGCGSSSIGKALANELGLGFFSAGKKYKSFGKGENETEKAIDFLDSEEGTSLPPSKSIDDMQIELARKGNIVIDAKAGIHFLKDIADFKVWLRADFDIRVKRVAMRERWNFDETVKKLKEKERLERELFMKVYDFDYLLQERDADLILDVSTIEVKDVVGKILEKLKR